MRNPFHCIASRVAFDSPFFQVRQDTVVRPNGEESPFSVIQMKAGVSVLPITYTEDVYLVREFKYAIDRPSLEVVSGGVEQGEDPAVAARRELEEEAGLRANEWTPCGFVDPFTTILRGPVSLFIARDLQPARRNPEEGEILELEKVPLARAVQMIEAGGITHAPTCVLLYRARDLIARR